MDVVIQRRTQVAEQLRHDNEVKTLYDMLSPLEEFYTLTDRVEYFISLEQSTNTSDGKTVSLMDQFSQEFSGITKANARFNRYVAGIENLDACIKRDALLKECSYLPYIIKGDSTYLLSDDVEDVLSRTSISGGEAWANLQEYLTSTIEVEYRGEASTLSQIHNMAYDSDIGVCKSTYEVELRAYDEVRDAVAFSLNSIKVQVLAKCELRGFAFPLVMTLHDAHMKQEALNTLLHTVRSYVPKFHTCLRRKVELPGYKGGPPWYELFMPLGEETKTCRIGKAKECLLKYFHPFTKDMTDMMERVFDESWVNFLPRKGKVGGVFCANLNGVEQSRILTSYSGAFGDIVTLVHELGHAYHDIVIENHRPLNTGYPMLVAEAALTFNGDIIMSAAIEEAKGQEKITPTENQLQDLTRVICGIYSHFLFEKTVFGKHEDSFMFADKLEAIMTETQKQAYGGGLDPDYLHPYMRICKSHYYPNGLSFCSFPYAFGVLFARGPIMKYQGEKEAFIPRHRELPKATTASSVEDAAVMIDTDLCDEAFWTNCPDTCTQRIDELLELTEQRETPRYPFMKTTLCIHES